MNDTTASIFGSGIAEVAIIVGHLAFFALAGVGMWKCLRVLRSRYERHLAHRLSPAGAAGFGWAIGLLASGIVMPAALGLGIGVISLINGLAAATPWLALNLVTVASGLLAVLMTGVLCVAIFGMFIMCKAIARLFSEGR